jgi:hypothetical protein
MESDTPPDHVETKKERDHEHEIRIILDEILFSFVKETALYMQISQEELVMQILKGWMRKTSLPLHGNDRLCNLNPDSFS